MDTFANLKLSRWRQFNEVDLDLGSRLCVLTGPNGCGKTTILNVLGRHFGWNLHFLTASYLSEKERKKAYSDIWTSYFQPRPAENQVGSITYSSGAISQLVVPNHENQPQYHLENRNSREVIGLHIPSHRPPPAFHRVSQIPIDPKSAQEHYQQYQNFLFATYGESSSRNPTSAMKETLIAFAVFGEGNSSVQTNPEYRRIFEAFSEVLAQLLPDHIGFQSIEIRTPDVVLRTRSGDFPLEAMSGGLNALFAIAWQIHTYGFNKSACTVLIDEPENHLHPSMQREFLPKLVAAFPEYKFIVASHSPFVVSSEPSAAVYALIYNDDQRVVSQRLTEADLAGSPNKVLRDILDVQVTMPIWVERRIQAVLKKYPTAANEPNVLKDLRAELEEQGLGHALGDFLIQRKSIDEPETGNR
jgi:predicted ATPase